MGYYFDWCSWRAPLQDGSIDVCGMRLQSGNGDALIDDVFEFAVAAATPPIDAMCQARGSRHVPTCLFSRVVAMGNLRAGPVRYALGKLVGYVTSSSHSSKMEKTVRPSPRFFSCQFSRDLRER